MKNIKDSKEKNSNLFYRVKKTKCKCCDIIIDALLRCFFGCLCCCFETVDD